MILAAELDEVLQQLGVPAWVLGLFVLSLAVWRGWVVMRSDHDARMAAARLLCDAELAAKQVEVAQQVEARRLLQERLDQVVADRDAWRDAHGEAVAALKASERAGAALMEQGNLSVGLLAALKDALSGKGGG